MKIFVLVLFVFSFAVNSNAQLFKYADYNPIELGKVHWLRNYDAALLKAEKVDKPVFILFQEVPGCSNCTKYGKNILSHPLIVEAIEDEFIPLAIYNNKKGHDGEVLKYFNEPAWNNPVVRFVSSNGSEVGPRIGNFSSTSQLLLAMQTVIKNSKKEVPNYLTLLTDEYLAKENGTDDFYLSMYCFWTGEKEIAKIKGVIATEAGYMHGKEVVKVSFDESQTDISKIAHKASKKNCGDQVFTNVNVNGKIPSKKIGKYRKDGQDKYYLLHSPLKYLPMTEYQKSKVNSALGSNDDSKKYLSPRQLLLLKKSINTKNLIEEDFVNTWYKTVGVSAP
ncbi:MAG: VPGUxxT family thioredoxin-like (seleno)protein, type 2 [Saprospiraceae bacterium]